MRKQKEGVELDEQQLAKVSKLPQVMESLQEAMKEATDLDLSVI